jgi:isopenicillin N synthase-like dioxygenase
LNELYEQLEKLGCKILSLISLGLDLEEDWFKDKINQGNSILRLIHYPKIKKNNMGIRAEKHEDINLVTFLLGTKQKGLEILNNDRKWMPLAVSPETIICNVGDMLERLTNDKLKSTTHRVINPRGDEAQHSRYSMPFFIHLNPDHIISTIPSCIDRENKNKYQESITADNFLQERLREIKLK